MVKIVLGTMEFGRRLAKPDCQKMLKLFCDAYRGFEIDTASMYSNGISEEILGEIISCDSSLSKIGISTKVNPTNGGFIPANLRNQFESSLGRLKTESVETLYLHWPGEHDRIYDILECVDQLYREGKFRKLGLSNYSSWQVAQIYHLCEKNQWVLPTIYQGMYNMLTRRVEEELIPCLRNYSISFHAYNPLAGGILSGRYSFDDLKKFNEQTQCRFHNVGGTWAKAYQDRFWKNEYFTALDQIQAISDNLLETSFSWLKNHSALSESNDDAIVIGASSIEQFEKNMNIISDCRPLTSQVQTVCSEAYFSNISGVCPSYYR